jgi:hypothetical protein
VWDRCDVYLSFSLSLSSPLFNTGSHQLRILSLMCSHTPLLPYLPRRNEGCKLPSFISLLVTTLQVWIPPPLVSKIILIYADYCISLSLALLDFQLMAAQLCPQQNDMLGLIRLFRLSEPQSKQNNRHMNPPLLSAVCAIFSIHLLTCSLLHHPVPNYCYHEMPWACIVSAV